MYEGEVRGRVEVGLRYTPIPCVSELQLLDTNLQFQRHDIKSRGDCRVWNGVNYMRSMSMNVPSLIDT